MSTSTEVDGFLQQAVVFLRNGAAACLTNTVWRWRWKCRWLVKARSGVVLGGNGRGGAQVVAKPWSRSGHTSAAAGGVDDLERVAEGVARRRGVDDLGGLATTGVSHGSNHGREFSEGFQRRRLSDGGSGNRCRSDEMLRRQWWMVGRR